METKPEYHTEDGPSVPKKTPEPLAYKPLWVHPDTHQQVKQLAQSRGITIIDLIKAWVKAERSQ